VRSLVGRVSYTAIDQDKVQRGVVRLYGCLRPGVAVGLLDFSLVYDGRLATPLLDGVMIIELAVLGFGGFFTASTRVHPPFAGVSAVVAFRAVVPLYFAVEHSRAALAEGAARTDASP